MDIETLAYMYNAITKLINYLIKYILLSRGLEETNSCLNSLYLMN